MSVKIEFNPDLSLRTYNTKDRAKEECLPEKIRVGETHHFLKKGQRAYWLEGEIPLYRTNGGGAEGSPLAMIRVTEETHFIREGEIMTRGTYEITKKVRKR
jgi:hypothetical protein